jgi:hypothetical protein
LIRTELGRKQVLTIVDLEGNPAITLEALFLAQQGLSESGSTIRLRCNGLALGAVNSLERMKKGGGISQMIEQSKSSKSTLIHSQTSVVSKQHPMYITHSNVYLY